MKKLNSRNLKALTLLSVVLPISLLVSFRLTGILQEPITISETITLETIKWEFERLNQTVTLNETLESQYSNSEMSTIMRVMIGSYIDHDPGFDDYVTMGVSTNSTITTLNGFVESVYITLHKDNQCIVEWQETLFHFENLSLVGKVEGFIRDREAYINLRNMNHSKVIYLSATPTWFLLTPNSQTHQMEITFELTYYNGTAYKKLIQLFQLKLLGDEGTG